MHTYNIVIYSCIHPRNGAILCLFNLNQVNDVEPLLQRPLLYKNTEKTAILGRLSLPMRPDKDVPESSVGVPKPNTPDMFLNSSSRSGESPVECNNTDCHKSRAPSPR